MADKKQSPTEKAAPDPTVKSGLRGPEYPEGTHPPVDPSEATWGPGRFSYSDLEEKLKPAKDTVAQQIDADPIQDDVREAIAKDQEAGQKAQAREQAQKQ